MRSRLVLIYENFWLISSVMIIIIIFFIIYEKKNKKVESYSPEQINKKNLYLNRIDIIGNKVGIIILLCLIIIVSIIYVSVI